MLMVSIRRNFWDAAAIGTALSWARVAEDKFQTSLLDSQGIKNTLEQLKNKRVLLLIHGFNDNEQEAVQNYFKISENIQKWVVDSEKQECLYDAIIGFVWPGYAHAFDYYFAKKNALTSSTFLREILNQLSADAEVLDILSHSMGNLLLLEALDYVNQINANPAINTLFSVAPAVNDDSIDKKHQFFQSTLNALEIVVLYSNRDPVEKWGYLLAEHAKALGEEGDGYPLQLPPNVQMLNCSALVSTHSGYFDQEPIYEWIKNKKTKEIAGPDVIQDMEFSTDGKLSITRWREKVDKVS
jgi:esterase/lipase superfamily enzyme